MKIITGGQTGVDRAALNVAIERGMDWGGWCPKGGWAEDLPTAPGLLAKYPKLKETPQSNPLQRTEWNVVVVHPSASSLSAVARSLANLSFLPVYLPDS